MKRSHHRAASAIGFLTVFLVAGSFISLQAQDAKEFQRRADVLRRAVQRCEERIGSGELSSCGIDVGFGVNRRVSIEEALRMAGDYEERARQSDRDSEKAQCQATRERYLRDMIAVERMQKTIQMGQQELETWTRKNEEAQYAAIKSALNLLLNGGLAYVAESTQVLNGLKGAYKSYETKLSRRNGPIDPEKNAKLIALDARIQKMSAAIAKAKQLQDKKEKAEIFWGYFTAETREVDASADSFKAALSAVEEDPLLNKMLVDKGLLPMLQRLKTKELMPKKPYLVTLLQFAVDYGYSATEWVASRNRILQQSDVSDQQLQAVNSLQEELKKTMKALNACVDKGLVSRP